MRLKKLLKHAWLLSVSGSVFLAGCQTTTGSADLTTNSLRFCDGAKPIYWSKKDTDKTVWAVKAHNAVGKQACGWGKKP